MRVIKIQPVLYQKSKTRKQTIEVETYCNEMIVEPKKFKNKKMKSKLRGNPFSPAILKSKSPKKTAL